MRAVLACLVLGCLLAGCAFPMAAPNPTPSPTAAPTPTTPQQPTRKAITPGPGLLLRGRVLLRDGSPLQGVKIFRSLAGYQGEAVAVTGADGFFESDLKYIPGDEMISVWAELPGYTISPDDTSCQDGRCYWRHYASFEERSLFFTAQSQP